MHNAQPENIIKMQLWRKCAMMVLGIKASLVIWSSSLARVRQILNSQMNLLIFGNCFRKYWNSRRTVKDALSVSILIYSTDSHFRHFPITNAQLMQSTVPRASLKILPARHRQIPCERLRKLFSFISSFLLNDKFSVFPTVHLLEPARGMKNACSHLHLPRLSMRLFLGQQIFSDKRH